MSVIASALKHMLAAGMPAEAMLAAVAAMEAEIRAVPKQPTKGALRMRAYRVRHGSSQSVTSDEGDAQVTLVTPGDAAAPSPDKDPQTPKINPTPHTQGGPTHEREAETPVGIQPLCWAIAIVSTAWTLRTARWKGTPPPAGVADDCWAGFLEHRKGLPKAGKFTDRAYRLLCKKLADLAEAGFPPGAMIDRAVEHGWITVYPPKEPAHARPRPANDRDGHRNSMVRAGLAREARYAGEPDHGSF